MSDVESVQAIILAGGLGTRLRSVVSDRPKVMALVQGKPFIQFLLEQISSFGISKVIISTGYLAKHISGHFGSKYKNLHITYVQESEPLGTGGALFLAAKQVTAKNLLVLNGDSFCHFDFASFYSFHLKQHAQITLLLTKVPDVSRYGQVVVTDSGKIQSFIEKSDTAQPGLINAGIYLLSPGLFSEYSLGNSFSLERELFPKLLNANLYGYEGGGDFIDIGTPESLVRANSGFKF